MKLRLIAGLAGFLIAISSVAGAQAQTEPDQIEPAQADPVQADPAQADPAQADPAQTEPAQKASGVARISLIHGDVSTQRGDSGDWGAAALNAPVVAGDRVTTGDKARTEVQLDYANILRLDEHTQANVTALSSTQIQVQIARGLANYSVLKDSEAEVEIDAPNLSVHPRRGDGSYRITVLADDQAEVLVRKGEADISTPQGSTHVRSGQLITVRGTGNDTQYQVADARSRDDFDHWNSDRDNTIRNAQGWNHTNRYYVGSEDLDAYGHWQNVPDYGQVWEPAVASDWAPYREGRWVWEPYWGWTWVSYEPWGWAPYHYGRWFLYDNSWVWWPGQSYGYRDYRPIWAPAYVSFFGFGGGGVGFGFGFGSVGWLPIGPCDRFYPWWGGYRSRFNVTNINIYNVHNGGFPPLRTGTRYSNLRLAGSNDRMRLALSTVRANDFGRGRVTPQPVSRETFRGGRMVAGNLPVVPTRESLLAGERRAAPPTAGRGGQSQRFFGTNRQVSTARSFDREAADLHNAIQRDGHFTPIVGNQRSNAGEGNLRTVPQVHTGANSGAMKPSAGIRVNGSNQSSNQSSNLGSNQTWRRVGQPSQPSTMSGTSASNPGQRRSTAGETSDWRRSPTSGAPQGSARSGVPSYSNPAGRATTPFERRSPTPAPQGNQDWRRFDRSSETVTRSTSGPTGVPASRDRYQRENSTPTADRGSDWRRMPASRPTSSAPTVSRDPGNWRQPIARDNSREVSRPPLDMRQPIVTPRSSGPSSYGGGGYSPRSSGPSSYGGGGYSPRSSGPSSYGGYHGNSGGGGGGGGRPAPSGGGGHSAPSGGGGHSSPSGGSGHSSGGNSGSHRGR